MRIVLGETGWRVLSPERPGKWVCLRRLALNCGYRICEVCGELGCSERYFHEVSTRDIGLPPKLWMRWDRMVRARHMLSDGADYADVAETLGFSTAGSFRREFRAVYGVLPKEYIQRTERADPK